MHFKLNLKGYQLPLLVILFFLSSSVLRGQNEQKVLFVGNSYTYFWNLPQTVEAMLKSQDMAFKTAQSTAGGTSWLDHWAGNKALKSRAIIGDNQWDIVVLQNHSKSTIDNLNEFHEYGQKFIDLVASNRAKPVLYITWAREFNPLMQNTITQEYLKLAEEHKLDAIPVGPIWELVRQLRPDLKLYDDDKSHPSPLGTYLTALAFTKYLSQSEGMAIPNRLTSQDYSNEKLYLHIVPANDAEFLNQVVEDFDFTPFLKSNN